MKIPSFSTVQRGLAALMLLAGPAVTLAQDFPPGEPVRAADDTVSYGIWHESGAGERPPVEIIDVNPMAPGATGIVFTGEAGKDYMVWTSPDMQSWSYGGMAGLIGPQLFSGEVVTDPERASSFHVVMEVEDAVPVNPLQLRNDLLGMVAYRAELSPQEAQALAAAAQALVEARVAKAQAEAALVAKQRQLAHCKSNVEALRQAAAAAAAALRQAEAAVEAASQEVAEIGAMIPDAEADLAAELANLAEWEAWAPGEIAALEAQKAATSDPIEQSNIQGRINLLRNALERRRSRVALAQALLAGFQERMAAAQAGMEQAVAGHAAAVGAEAEARAAYEAAKESCAACEAAVAEAQRELKEACDRLQDAAGGFDRARLVANEKADGRIEDRRRREAAAQAELDAAELARRLAQDAVVKADLEKQLAEWKKFFDAIRDYAGEEEAKRVAGELGEQISEGGIAVLEIFAGALEALALGKTVAEAIGGMVLNGLQVGYGVLVAYAQSVAVNAVVQIASGHVARMLKEMSDLKPGQSRFHNMKSGFYLVMRNADGTFTVFSYTKNYFTSGGTFGTHVLK